MSNRENTAVAYEYTIDAKAVFYISKAFSNKHRDA
jgi:hypothetical protein